MNLALGMGLFKHSPGMTQEADKSSIVFLFSALIYPYLSRKWSGTFTYKIMKDLFDFPRKCRKIDWAGSF